MGFKEDNEKDRLKFVDFWSKYVRSHEDHVWSRQQNVIINSALRTCTMTKEQYLEMKGEKTPKKDSG